MSRRYRRILAAGIVFLPALWFSPGREACAQQVNVVNTRGLDFGQFVGGTGGTVVMSPLGARSRTGGVILLTSPSAGQATFSVSKSSNGGTSKSIIISLPANGSTVLTSGSNTMAVNSFVSSPSTLTTLSTTATPLSVGATLSVAANQAPGSYSGSFSVIINYQ